MPKTNRKDINAKIFHIMSQGINKEYIFDKNQDKRKYIELIKKYFDKYDIEIIAYCIMSNHVHILLKQDNVEKISKFMYQINMEYALYYNKNRKRVGYVFRGRFKSEGVCDEEYLISCINYIHDNPVKAKICKNKKEYLYSSINYQNNEKQIIDGKWIKNYYDLNLNNKDNYNLFIEIEEEQEQNIIDMINKYLYNNNVNIDQLKNNKEILKGLLNTCINQKISLRRIEKIIEINRKKLKQIMEEK